MQKSATELGLMLHDIAIQPTRKAMKLVLVWMETLASTQDCADILEPYFTSSEHDMSDFFQPHKFLLVPSLSAYLFCFYVSLISSGLRSTLLLVYRFCVQVRGKSLERSYAGL